LFDKTVFVVVLVDHMIPAVPLLIVSNDVDCHLRIDLLPIPETGIGEKIASTFVGTTGRFLAPLLGFYEIRTVELETRWTLSFRFTPVASLFIVGG